MPTRNSTSKKQEAGQRKAEEKKCAFISWLSASILLLLLLSVLISVALTAGGSNVSIAQLRKRVSAAAFDTLGDSISDDWSRTGPGLASVDGSKPTATAVDEEQLTALLEANYAASKTEDAPSAIQPSIAPSSQQQPLAKPSDQAISQLVRKIGVPFNEALQRERLSFQWMTLDDEDVKVVAYMVASSAVLQELSLGGNNIGHLGAAVIGEALKGNAVLEKLILNKNKIGDVGAAAIGEALKGNAVLQELYLERNKIGDVGAAAIGEALKGNAVLKVLYLGQNEIGDEGAKAIGEALKGNAVLQTLYLYENKIGDVGAAAIGEALKRNAVLRLLVLQSNKLTYNGERALNAANKQRSAPLQLYL